jgi:hypothetical protein
MEIKRIILGTYAFGGSLTSTAQSIGMCHSDGSSSSLHNIRIGLLTTDAAAGHGGSKPTFRDRPLLKGQNSDRRQLLR